MKKVLMYAVVASAMLASCSSNEEIANASNSNVLGVDVNVMGAQTKSLVGSDFSTAAIGLILDDAGDAYISAVKSYTQSVGVWSTTPPFYLSNIVATVYGLFPYPAAPATDVDLEAKTLKKVTVLPTMNFRSVAQHDYMYATARAGEGTTPSPYTYPLATASNTDAAKNVKLFFHHALSKLKFKINNVDYTGVGKINSLTLESVAGNAAGLFKVGTEGVMSLCEVTEAPAKVIGEISNLTATNKITLTGTSITATLDVMSTAAAVTANGYKAGKIKIAASEPEIEADYAFIEALVAPITLGLSAVAEANLLSTSNSIKLTLVVDETPKSVWIKFNAGIAKWEAGKEYVYTLNVGATGLTITNISIVDWTSVADDNALEIK